MLTRTFLPLVVASAVLLAAGIAVGAATDVDTFPDIAVDGGAVALGIFGIVEVRRRRRRS